MKKVKIKIDNKETSYIGLIDNKAYVETDVITELTGLDIDIKENEININTLNAIDIPIGKTIIIDAGHGGKDSGAIDGKDKSDDILTYEKNLNLEIAKLVYKKLDELNAKVILIRNSDEFVKLSTRTKIANDNNADLFLSIHFNASSNESVKGIETFKCKGTKNPISHKFANNLQKALIETTKFKDRKVKEANYYVLKHTKMPACLVELGFITNNDEEKIVNSSEFKNKVANALVKAILETLNG